MRIYLLIFVSFLASQGFSQEITGRAFYTSMYKFDEPDFDQEQMQDPRTKALAEQLKQGFQDQYQLDFTQEESIFKKLPKLETPDPKRGSMSISVSVVGDDEILYKSIKENQLVNETELYGKPFLIQDDLEIRDWKLSKESKTIGEYVCFKATYVPSAEDKDKDEDEDEDENEDTTRLRSGIDDKDEDKEIIAWYTPQIPVKNGPKNYEGLPGLILELQDGNLKFLCTKIVLNPEEKVVITKPTKGKKVNQKEFKAIVDKKNEEMMENFKSQKRRRD
jgi:GLPGLI family protein